MTLQEIQNLIPEAKIEYFDNRDFKSAAWIKDIYWRVDIPGHKCCFIPQRLSIDDSVVQEKIKWLLGPKDNGDVLVRRR
jgi:hypothetical protein